MRLPDAWQRHAPNGTAARFSEVSPEQPPQGFFSVCFQCGNSESPPSGAYCTCLASALVKDKSLFWSSCGRQHVLCNCVFSVCTCSSKGFWKLKHRKQDRFHWPSPAQVVAQVSWKVVVGARAGLMSASCSATNGCVSRGRMLSCERLTTAPSSHMPRCCVSDYPKITLAAMTRTTSLMVVLMQWNLKSVLLIGFIFRL